MASIDEEIKSRFRNEQQRAMVHVMFTANRIKSRHSASLKPHGLSTEQYNILRILNGSKEERMKMNSVRDRMIDPSPNTTRLMDKLLEKGAVERERCSEDRRVVFVKITDKGRKLLESLDKELSQFFGSAESALSQKEAAQLNELLEKFRSRICPDD